MVTILANPVRYLREDRPLYRVGCLRRSLIPERDEKSARLAGSSGEPDLLVLFSVTYCIGPVRHLDAQYVHFLSAIVPSNPAPSDHLRKFAQPDSRKKRTLPQTPGPDHPFPFPSPILLSSALCMKRANAPQKHIRRRFSC